VASFKTFYTYVWLREDNTPYYVGKGSGQRAYRDGAPDRDRIIVQEWPDELTAFENEKRLIILYGRKDLDTGILNNKTDGGQGQAGLLNQGQHLKTLNAKRKGVPLSQEHRRKISKALKGKKNPAFGKERPDVSSRNRITKKGRHMSKESRIKMSRAHLGKKLSESHKKNMRRPHKTYRRKNV
jgi:hypothetical protein